MKGLSFLKELYCVACVIIAHLVDTPASAEVIPVHTTDLLWANSEYARDRLWYGGIKRCGDTIRMVVGKTGACFGACVDTKMASPHEEIFCVGEDVWLDLSHIIATPAGAFALVKNHAMDSI